MKKDLKGIEKKALGKRFYYLPDDKRYAKKEGGIYYWINDGKVEQHQTYIDIVFGDIYSSEEEFYEALEKSKKKVKGYK